MTKRKSMFLILTLGVLAGCGPSDATINSNVKAKLAADATVSTATIDASTQKKIVTLTGTVDSQAVKAQAVTVAHQVEGVSNVIDQITVKESDSVGPGPGMGQGMMKKGTNNEAEKGHGHEGKHE